MFAWIKKGSRLTSGRNVLLSWLGHLFNPPALTSLSHGQRIARSFYVALTLFAACITVATLGAVTLYLVSHACEIVQDQTVMAGTGIVVAAIVGDAFCLRTLLAIKRST